MRCAMYRGPTVATNTQSCDSWALRGERLMCKTGEFPMQQAKHAQLWLTIHPKFFTNWFPSRFFCICFCIFLREFVAATDFCCEKKQQSESTDIARPMWCFFVSLGAGGWKTFFCNFYDTNSSQDFFLYCEDFGVDGKQKHREGLLSHTLDNVTSSACPAAIAESNRFLSAPGHDMMLCSRSTVRSLQEMLRLLKYLFTHKSSKLTDTLHTACHNKCQLC